MYRFAVNEVVCCPQNKTAWDEASVKLNCTQDDSRVNRYHCLPNRQKSALLEFCYDQLSGRYEKEHCIHLAESGYLNTDSSPCISFKNGCPTKTYLGDEIYQYPACLQINPHDKCYIADPSCPNISRETTTTYITTLDSQETVTSFNTNTTEIYNRPEFSVAVSKYVGLIAFFLVIVLILLILRSVLLYRRGKKRQMRDMVTYKNEDDVHSLLLVEENRQNDVETVQGMPQQPRVSLIGEIKPTSIQFDVSFTKVANDPQPKRLVVKYNAVGQEEQTITKDIYLDADDRPHNVHVLIASLAPSTSYSFSFVAYSDAGQGHKTTERHTTEAKRKPYPVQINSMQDSQYPTSYTLSWDTINDGGELLTNIVVRHREVSVRNELSLDNKYQRNSILGKDWISTRLVANQLTYTITNLQPSTFYEVDVQGINSLGSSPPPVPDTYFIFKTKPDKPQPPRVSLIGEIKPTSIQFDVSFTQVANGPQPKQLLVKYNAAGQEEQTITKYIYLDADDRPQNVQVLIASLAPSTSYSFSFVAYSDAGQGQETTERYTTEAKRKPYPVQINSMQDSQYPTSYTLSWDTINDGGELLTNVVVWHREVSVRSELSLDNKYQRNSILGEAWISTRLVANQLTYTITNLQPSTFYEVDVQGINNLGSSPPPAPDTYFIFKTKADSMPIELRNMEEKDQKSFLAQLAKGNQTIFHARGMLIGCGGSGKTTLFERLKNEDMSTEEIEKLGIESTVGADVHTDAFIVDEKNNYME